MMPDDRAALWTRLSAAGLTQGDPPPVRQGDAPWYVRAMVGVAAWIAACFLLLFIGVGFKFAFDTPTTAIVIGVGLCGAAIALLWARGAFSFVSQFALALCLAGQAMVVIGLFMHAPRAEGQVYAAIAAFEGILAFAVPSSVHRTWSTFAGAIALLCAVLHGHAAYLYPVMLAAAFVAVELNEGRLARTAGLWQPVGAGLALALVLVVPATVGFGLLNELTGTRGVRDVAPSWMTSLPVAIVFVGTVALLLARGGVRRGGRVELLTQGGAVAFAVAAWQVPGVVVSALVVIVAFASGRRALIGIGLVAIVVSLGYYSYSLQATLIAKSLSLMAAGAVLLAARFAVRHWLRAPSSEARGA